jgi:hypothetical protein
MTRREASNATQANRSSLGRMLHTAGFGGGPLDTGCPGAGRRTEYSRLGLFYIAVPWGRESSADGGTQPASSPTLAMLALCPNWRRLTGSPHELAAMRTPPRVAAGCQYSPSSQLGTDCHLPAEVLGGGVVAHEI